MSGRRKILFNDITLRDGEQSPGVNFLPDEKLKIAVQLCRLGMPIIEAGFAVASESDFAGVELIARTLGGPDGPIICSMARAHPRDIQAAYDALKPAARPRIQVVLATSDLHLEHKLRMTREQALKTAAEMVAFARSLVEDVEFAAEDATRSDPDFLCQVFTAAVEAGARTLEIPDTVGYSLPEEYAGLVRRVIDDVVRGGPVTVATHCHDDLGLAAANTLAGIAAGAGQAETTINGIGERAGNAAFEEVVMALTVRESSYGVETGIVTAEIKRASDLVRDLSHMAVAPNKAIVGRNAFLHESGIHQHGMLRDRRTYQIMDPEMVGVAGGGFNLGKLSGSHALRDKLSELGFNPSDDVFNAVYQDFKRLAGAKKFLADEDLINLVGRHA